MMISGRDSGLLVLLIAALLVATWPFFGPFTLMAVTAGLWTGLMLRAWHNRHPTVFVVRGRNGRPPEINISAIHVGGDIGGLMFAAGCIAILVIGMPGMRWFLGLSLILACALATAIIGWRRIHSVWSAPHTPLGR